MSVPPRQPPTIAVVDYDIGNLHSACKGLEFAGAIPIVTDDPQVMAQADGLLLPGVGAFDPAIRHLRDRDLIEPLRAIAASGKPFLGICLGMQIMVDGSDEGEEPGLGIIPGRVRLFRSEPEIRVPQMGWNTLELTQADCPLWQQLPAQPWMYFVHSYYVEPIDGAVNAAIVTHGSQRVSAALRQGSVMATQFHPEKSSRDGLAVLANFVDYVAAR
jgi:imidazole glycerol-phosphate synthase subunit HisH